MYSRPYRVGGGEFRYTASAYGSKWGHFGILVFGHKLSIQYRSISGTPHQLCFVLVICDVGSRLQTRRQIWHQQSQKSSLDWSS